MVSSVKTSTKLSTPVHSRGPMPDQSDNDVRTRSRTGRPKKIARTASPGSSMATVCRDVLVGRRRRRGAATRSRVASLMPLAACSLRVLIVSSVRCSMVTLAPPSPSPAAPRRHGQPLSFLKDSNCSCCASPSSSRDVWPASICCIWGSMKVCASAPGETLVHPTAGTVLVDECDDVLGRRRKLVDLRRVHRRHCRHRPHLGRLRSAGRRRRRRSRGTPSPSPGCLKSWGWRGCRRRRPSARSGPPSPGRSSQS